MTSKSADKRVGAAHTKVLETQAAVASAVKALAAAQTFLDDIERELAKHLGRNQQRAAERAAKLMAALKMGSSPPAFTKSGMAADHVAVTDAEHRRDAAKIAVDKLGAEVSAARLAHDDARNALEVEARIILAREAEGVVERIAELEHDALQHRIELEGILRSGVLGWGSKITISDAGKRTLTSNEMTRIGVKQDAAWHAANAAAERVRHRYDDLMKSNAALVSAPA
jgi:hypothetical protein